MMKTRIVTLLAALLLTAASTTAQTKIATTISVAVNNGIVAGDDAVVTVSLTDANNNGVTGIATISVQKEGESAKPYNVAVVEGTGTYYVSDLADASYTITASYAGDDVYAASQTAEAYSLYISKIATSLDISIDKTEMHVSETAKVSIQLNKSINAVVTLKFTDKEEYYDDPQHNFIVALVNGNGSFDLTGLVAGTYKVAVIYSGDDKYVGDNKTLTLTVNDKPVTATVSNEVLITDDHVAQFIVNFTRNVTGDVQLNISNDSYNETFSAHVSNHNVAIVDVPQLANGVYNVSATLLNDDYNCTSVANTVTVNTGITNPTERMAVVNITVTPTNYTGYVDVTVGETVYNDVPVYNGKGSLHIPELDAGTYTVSATLAEDAKYEESTTAAEIVAVPGITFPFAANQTWATWCDDWAWKKPAGVTAYTISAVSGNTVTISEVEGDNIPSHTPLLLKKISNVVTPTKVITGTGTDDLVSTTPEGATFYGNASDAKITTGYNYAIGQSYGLYNGEFMLIDTDNGIPANRCLLTLDDPTLSSPRLQIVIEGEATSLSEAKEDSSLFTLHSSLSGWYTLDGRKLDKQPTVKGLYIHNGRKVVIK